MKKNILVSFLVATLLATVLTACGSNSTTVSSSKTDDFHGEGEIQGGIKSDEDLARIEEEVRQYDEAKNDSAEGSNDSDMLAAGEAANVEMEGHEPDGPGSGNFQDYWQGENYFDLVSYMKDNGYELVVPYTFINYGESLKDGETAEVYECRNEDTHDWIIAVEKERGLQVDRNDFDIMYYVSTDKEKQISIDQTGMTISESAIVALNTVVETLKVNADSEDPLNGTGLTYEVRQ
ncbi:hypothetical protein IJ768_00640 [Candidatus Saccharibacteria bacterium]|nr:hypothetical protein [Candidatus Saccharibacteria bacterium]